MSKRAQISRKEHAASAGPRGRKKQLRAKVTVPPRNAVKNLLSLKGIVKSPVKGVTVEEMSGASLINRS